MKKMFRCTIVATCLLAALPAGAQTASKPAAPLAAPPATAPPAAAPPADISAISVRFFGDTCLKYATAPPELVKFLDATFTRQDAAHNLPFRQAANASDAAIVWLAGLPEGNFAVLWDPAHDACHLIGQKALDAGKVRVELNRMIADINASGQVQAKLVAAPVQPGSFTENIQIDGLPGRMIGIVASVNTAPKAGQAGSFYTLFVRHLTPAAARPAAPAPAAATPPAQSAAPAAPPAQDDVITP